MKTVSFLLLAVVISISCTVSARTWRITPGGMGDAPTIQAGIDSAAAGDTVTLANGTFTGPGNRDVEYFGKAITVRSESGDPELCIIDCEECGRGFIFQHSEGPGSVLEGITITRGYHYLRGGAVYIEYWAGPTIRNCAFVSNSVRHDIHYQGTGGAIKSDAFYTELRITGCTFVGNTAFYGGAMCCDGQWFDDIVDSCLFVGNSAVAGGALATRSGHYIGDFRHCTFRENSAEEGGAVWTDNGWIGLIGCTFVKNSADRGSAIYCYSWEGSSSILMYNCIVAYGTGGYSVYSESDVPGWGGVELNCCDIWGNAGGDWEGEIQDQLGTDGNFSACPSFCNIVSEPYDLHLCSESPCLPGNHPDGYDCGAGAIGVWGEGCVCGPTHTEPTTWSAIKSMYR